MHIFSWRQVISVAMVVGIPFLARPVMAQSVGVSPLVTIEQLKGSQSKTTITVTNSSDKPFRARIATADFTYDRETGFVQIAAHSKSAAPYLQFSPREFIVPPGVTRTVRVGFTVPPSLSDGEYSVALYVEGLAEQQISQEVNGQKTTVNIRPRVASIFFINKGGGASKLSVVSAQWNQKTKEPTLILNNQGTASAYPNLNWQISKGGAALAAGKLEGIVLVSGKERSMPIKTTEKDRSALAAGSYQISGEIVSRSGGNPIKFETQLVIP